MINNEPSTFVGCSRPISDANTELSRINPTSYNNGILFFTVVIDMDITNFSMWKKKFIEGENKVLKLTKFIKQKEK